MTRKTKKRSLLSVIFTTNSETTSKLKNAILIFWKKVKRIPGLIILLLIFTTKAANPKKRKICINSGSN